MAEPNIQVHQAACKDVLSPRTREQLSKAKKNQSNPLRNSDMTDHRRFQKMLVDVDHEVMSTISDNIMTSVQEHTICHKCGNFDCSCLFECGDFESAMEEESQDESINHIDSDGENELLDMLNVQDEFLDFPVKERDILNIYQKSENYGLYFPCECDNQEIKSVLNLSDGTSLDNLIIDENSNTDLVSDSAVIEKIQEAEHQALETGNLIKELKEKQRILLQKENLSEEDGKRIREYKSQIDEKLEYLESITRNVSHLIGLPSMNQLNCQTKHSEIFEKVSELSNKLSETISSIVSVEKRKSRLDLIHIKSSLTNNVCSKTENEQVSYTDTTEQEEKTNVDNNNLEIQEIFVAPERENSLCEKGNCEESILKAEECDTPSVRDAEATENTENLHSDGSADGEQKICEDIDTEMLKGDCIDCVCPKDTESCEDLVKSDRSDSEELKSKKSSVSCVNVSKVIIQGSDNNFPKILVCDEPHGKSDQTFTTLSEKQNNPEVVVSLTGRLCESYSLQEKLAVQFGELEGGRYHIQEELLQRDDTVDSLQRKVSSLQSEVKLMAKENALLTEKISYHSSHTSKSCSRCSESKSRAQNKCEQFIMKMVTDSNGSQLEYQLSTMENEMRNIQHELDMVQQQRQLIEQQKEMLKSKSLLPTNIASEQEIIILSEELKKLQDEYDVKMSEVNQLRHLVDTHKHKAETAVATRAEAEEKLKLLQQRVWQAEVDAKQVAAMKQELVHQEQELETSDQRLNESKFEIEELKNLLQEQLVQVENYRNKYLQTQQLYEEQRRELESMEGENKHVKDTVEFNIQRAKNQFQEKLQKLLPLAEVLTTAQRNLQDVQHKRCVAERHCEELTKEINEMKKHGNAFLQELEDRKILLHKNKLELEKLQERLDSVTKENIELKEEAGELKVKIARLEEIRDNNEKRYEEKSIELAKLSEKLAEIHNECSQQIERAKERSEMLKISLQNEISELEKQLAQSRAIANSAKRERDDIRQKMQCQINQLNESFNLAKARIQELQTHVIDLKASYNNAVGKEDEESEHPYLEAN